MARNIYRRRLSQLVRSTYLVEQLALDGGRPAQVMTSDTLDFNDNCGCGASATNIEGMVNPYYINRSLDYQTERHCRFGAVRLPVTEFFCILAGESMADDLPLDLYIESQGNPASVFGILARLTADVISSQSPIRTRTGAFQECHNHRERFYHIKSPTRADRRQTRKVLAEVAGD